MSAESDSRLAEFLRRVEASGDDAAPAAVVVGAGEASEVQEPIAQFAATVREQPRRARRRAGPRPATGAAHPRGPGVARGVRPERADAAPPLPVVATGARARHARRTTASA
ncbi:MAG: hypothetical protein ACQEXM_22255 [Actinomycetota bacterium]